MQGVSSSSSFVGTMFFDNPVIPYINVDFPYLLRANNKIVKGFWDIIFSRKLKFFISIGMLLFISILLYCLVLDDQVQNHFYLLLDSVVSQAIVALQVVLQVGELLSCRLLLVNYTLVIYKPCYLNSRKYFCSKLRSLCSFWISWVNLFLAYF